MSKKKKRKNRFKGNHENIKTENSVVSQSNDGRSIDPLMKNEPKSKDSDRSDKKGKDLENIESLEKKESKLLKAITSIFKKAEEKTVPQDSLSLKLSEKLKDKGDLALAKKIEKVKFKQPKPSKPHGNLILSLKLAISTLVLVVTLASGYLLLWDTESGGNLGDLAQQPSLPLITINPTKKDESNFMTTDSELIISLGSPIIGDPKKAIVISPEVDFNIGKTEDGDLTIKPVESLQSDKLYSVTIVEGTRFENGSVVEEPLEWLFKVDPAFAVMSTNPRDGYNGAPVNTAIEIVFTHQNFDPATASQFIKIEPNVGFKTDKVGNKLILMPEGGLLDFTKYQVTVSSELQTLTGDKLDTPYKFGFTTGYSSSTSGEYSTTLYWSNYNNVVSNSGDFQLLAYSYTGVGGGQFAPITYRVYSIPTKDINEFSGYITKAPYSIPEGSKMLYSYTQNVNVETVYWKPPSRGLYLVVATADGAISPIYKYYISSDIGVYATEEKDSLVGWAYNMESEQPIKDLTIYPVKDGQVGSSVSSDNTGYFKLPKSKFYVGIANGNYLYYPSSDIAYFNDYVGSDANFGYNSNSVKIKDPNSVEGYEQMFIFENRNKPAYKFGDQVIISGFVKGTIDSQISSVSGQILNVKVYGSEQSGNSFDGAIYERNIELGSGFGNFSYTFKLPENSDSSNVRIKYSIGENTLMNSNISIKSYQIHEEKFEIELDKKFAYSGESINAVIYGTDYTDAPLAGRDITVQLKKMTLSHYSDIKDVGYCYGQTYETRQVKLDNRGRASLTFTPTISAFEDWNIADFSLVVVQNSEFNFVENKSDCVRVAAADYDLDVKSVENSFKIGGSGVINLTSRKLWSLDRNPNQPYSLQVNRHWTEKIDDGERYNPDTGLMEKIYRYESRVEAAGSFSGVTDGNGEATLLVKDLKEGSYSVRVVDSKFSKYYDYVAYVDGSEGYQSEVSDIGLTISKDQVNVGDQIDVTISPEKDINGLLIVNGDQVFKSVKLQLKGGGGYTYEVPVTDQMYPDFQICVADIQQREDKTRLGNRWYDECKYVSVESDQGVMEVSVKTDKDEYKPGEEVVLNIKSSKSGKGVESNIQIFIVDHVLLDQFPYELEDIESDKLREIMYEKLRRRIYFTTNISFPDEGGRGAGGGGDEPFIREILDSKVYWNGSIRTGDNGEATVKFKANDALSTWRIQAISTDKSDGVGAGYTNYITKKESYIKTILPSFIRTGDNVMGDMIIVNNGTSYKGTLEINCHGCMEPKQVISIDVPSGSRDKYPVKLLPEKGATQLVIDSELINDKGSIDKLRDRIDIQPVGILSPTLTTKIVRSEGDRVVEEIGFELDEYEKSMGSVRLDISGTSSVLGTQIPVTTQYFNSRSLASAVSINSYAYKNYDRIKPELPKSALFEKIEQQFAQLALNQTPTGAFAEHSTGGAELDASVMALNAMLDMKDAGMQVDQTRILALKTYLSEMILNGDIHVAQKLYILSALSRIEPEFTISTLPYLKQLLEQDELLASSPFANASMSLIMRNIGNSGDGLYYAKKLSQMGTSTRTELYWSEPENPYYTMSDLELTAYAYRVFAPLSEWNTLYKSRNWLIENNSYQQGEFVYMQALYSLSQTDLNEKIGSLNTQNVKVTLNGSTPIGEIVLTPKSPNASIMIPAEKLKVGENVLSVEKSDEGEVALQLKVDRRVFLVVESTDVKVNYSYLDGKSGTPVDSGNLQEGQYYIARMDIEALKDLKQLTIRDQWSSTLTPFDSYLHGVPDFVVNRYYSRDGIPTNLPVYTPHMVGANSVNGSIYGLKKGQRAYFQYVVKADFAGTTKTDYLNLTTPEGNQSIAVYDKTDVVVK